MRNEIERKHKALIQQLAEGSFVGNEKETIARIRQIVEELRAIFKHSLKDVLHYYWICLEKAYARRYVQVEYAGCLSEENLKIFLQQDPVWARCKIDSQENPQLIGGIKVKHGDWVCDCSVEGQLQALTKTLKKL